MMLIADSGSTKTDWRFIDEFNNIHHTQSVGLNPYFTSEAEMVEALTTGPIKLFSPGEIQQIHFYGAGCSSEAQITKVEQALQQVYPQAEILVEHDLLGAARALCGRQKGISAILGTGSNSCMYDGEFIVKNIASLGYVLGDEGSGGYIGKLFLADALRGDIPEKLAKKFEEKFKLTREKALENVYMQPFPNRFLASFTRFLYQNMEFQYTKDLIANSFRAFFEKQVMQYEGHENMPVNFVGSIAFNFSVILREVAEEKNMEVGQILQAPIAALTLYHINENA